MSTNENDRISRDEIRPVGRIQVHRVAEYDDLGGGPEVAELANELPERRGSSGFGMGRGSSRPTGPERDALTNATSARKAAAKLLAVPASALVPEETKALAKVRAALAKACGEVHDQADELGEVFPRYRAALAQYERDVEAAVTAGNAEPDAPAQDPTVQVRGGLATLRGKLARAKAAREAYDAALADEERRVGAELAQGWQARWAEAHAALTAAAVALELASHGRHAAVLAAVDAQGGRTKVTPIVATAGDANDAAKQVRALAASLGAEGPAVELDRVMTPHRGAREQMARAKDWELRRIEEREGFRVTSYTVQWGAMPPGLVNEDDYKAEGIRERGLAPDTWV